jgi:hypothetical protein
VNSSNVSRLFVEEVNGTDTTVNLPIKNAYNFVNSGFGLDLGASYKVNDKLSLSASLLDLGIINWKDDVQNYTSNDIDYSFRGINIEGFLQDSLDVFDELVDSLNTVFEQDENNNAYSTSLQTRFYLGGRYELTKWLDVTGLFFSEVINKKYRGALHVGANAKVNQWLSATLNYGYYGRSWSNVGIGLSLRGGPVQFFLSIDNIMVGVVPLNQRNLHFATGLTLLFGKPDKAKKSKELALK